MANMYRTQSLIVSLCLLLLLMACQGSQKYSKESPAQSKVSRDLPEIREDGVLNVITLYNSTSYFIYRGQPMGFEYEMARRLSKSLGLKMNIVVAKSFNDVFRLLNTGKGDIIAFGLSITAPRKRKIAFTDYLYLTHQVLVQRKPANWRRLPQYKIDRHLIKDPIELIGDTVYVGKGTSYYTRLKHLEEEIGGKINIKQIDSGKTTDDLIHMVVSGKIDYTVADDNLASINKTYYPILDIGTALSFSQRIAWGMRKNSPVLLKAVNHWIDAIKKQKIYYVLYHKYFKNKKRYKRRLSSDLFSKNEGKISRYDSLIRKYGHKLGWDWRLLASQIYQESRFDKNDTSWAGAAGLMQIMPATAKELGIKNIKDPNDNIRGGTAYLQKIYDRFDKVSDSLQRIKFTLASYNCGFGHVRDAQRLAKALGENPEIWDNNVENAILKLQKRKYFTRPEVRYGFVRGLAPYDYVGDIFRRYQHYRELIPLVPPKTGIPQGDGTKLDMEKQ